MSSREIKASLFFTYLKDKTELYLYVKPQGTSGSRVIYRRAPGDAAMSLRIQALLDVAKVLSSNLEIWVLLYPPEIYTTTIYVESGISEAKLQSQIRENVLLQRPYSLNYDWKRSLIQRRDNGHGQEMVTITFLGKEVLPRIKTLLVRNFPKVKFIGDGLQFLRMNDKKYPDLLGKNYEVILPYDEIYYHAIFRSGAHIASIGLPHGCCSEFGTYKLEPQQVYLKINRSSSGLDLPRFQPLVEKSEWMETYLTPAAFPTWYIASRSFRIVKPANFTDLIDSENMRSDRKENYADSLGFQYSS